MSKIKIVKKGGKNPGDNRGTRNFTTFRGGNIIEV